MCWLKPAAERLGAARVLRVGRGEPIVVEAILCKVMRGHRPHAL